MKILVTGATGFIGSGLVKQLLDAGHRVVVVTRNSAKVREKFNSTVEVVECDLNKDALRPADFQDVNAIVNLTGESIDGRWTREKKSKILNSRVLSAKNLLQNCPSSVSTIITASAQGIYGDRGDEILTEESQPGTGFLADVCRAWEAEFTNRPQRVALIRFGVVLSKEGGALQKLIPLFKKNLGAPLGTGRQWVSYISLNDLVRLIAEVLMNEKYDGIINAVNNNPVTNAELSHALCRALKVWCLPAVPAIVIRLLLGEMSEVVLGSIRIKPRKLNEFGFKFQDETLDSVLLSI